MATTNFINRQTPILAEWLNDVDDVVYRKSSEWISVKDHGAVGDGITDDTAAFTSALAAGKNIFIPEGIYLVSAVTLTATSSADYGYNIRGASTTKTIIKGTASATHLLSVVGSGVFTQYHQFESFSLDMSLMTNAATRRGIYLKTGWGMSFRNINVLNSTSTQKAVYFDNQVYTTIFDNCDFGSTLGVVELQGVSLSDAVTTITFVGCSFGKMVVDYGVSITVVQAIVQGALDKFVLSNISGFTCLGSDVEGTGTYLVLGTNVNHLHTFGNELSGFSGTFSSGTMSSGIILDQYGSEPFQLAPNAGSTHTGTMTEQTTTAALTRKVVKNTNAVAQQVDLNLNNIVGDCYFGLSSTGNTVIDNRAGGDTILQISGVNKLGVDSSSRLIVETLSQTTVGAAGTATALPAQPEGYLRFIKGGVNYVVPYYKQA